MYVHPAPPKVFEGKQIHCCLFGAVPKVFITISSFDPEQIRPQIQTDLSGIAASGIAAFVVPGTEDALVVKVKTPVEETLYSVTGVPLKLNVNGIYNTQFYYGKNVQW